MDIKNASIIKMLNKNENLSSNEAEYSKPFEMLLSSFAEKNISVMNENVLSLDGPKSLKIVSPYNADYCNEDMTKIASSYCTSPTIFCDLAAEQVLNIASKLEQKPLIMIDENRKVDIFALAEDKNGTLHIFLQNEDSQDFYNGENITDNLDYYTDGLLSWINYVDGIEAKEACETNETTSKDIDLIRYATNHVATYSSYLYGKLMLITLNCVSCHQFGKGTGQGTDWFYFRQECNFEGGHSIYDNKENGYKYYKYWNGTRIKLYSNNDTWYVGQGQVCIYYIDYYDIQNYIENCDTSFSLVTSSPEAFNNVTTKTVGTEFGVSGELAFGSSDGKWNGQAKMSIGGKFSQSETENVFDCTGSSYIGTRNLASVGWNYRFRRASRNMSTGNWQYLIDPALLACSKSKFVNEWIWKIPTEKRSLFGGMFSFQTVLSCRDICTITRYSGSQSEKHIEAPNVEIRGFNVKVKFPPMLSIDKHEVTFKKEGGNDVVKVCSEGIWKIDDTSCDWCKLTSVDSTLHIEVSPNNTSQMRKIVCTIVNEQNGEKAQLNIVQYYV